ncbi:MAG: PIN domain-containing protein, partial [Bacteroidota bacterium]|nr:PIN domain-containing protein [Bacteroidota bacterium]
MKNNGNNNPKKIFVLDTSVILYNHTSIQSFEDNYIAIPITVLEELDTFKKGNEIKNFEAREFIRFLDSVSGNETMREWMPIEGNKKGKFKVVMHDMADFTTTKIFGEDKPDHRILSSALVLAKEYPQSK